MAEVQTLILKTVLVFFFQLWGIFSMPFLEVYTVELFREVWDNPNA